MLRKNDVHCGLVTPDNRLPFDHTDNGRKDRKEDGNLSHREVPAKSV
jgi:hypothetical protein